MRMLHRGLLVVLCARFVGCGPEDAPPQGQVLLYVDTDAPVGDVQGWRLDSAVPMPLFDRLLVEVFPPGAEVPCSGCVRELAVSEKLLVDRDFSFGVVAQPRMLGARVRLRLFRSAGRTEPRRESTIEVVGYLPAVGETGVKELTVYLPIDDLGQPRGSLESPVVFDAGRLSQSMQGTWSHAVRSLCTKPAPNGAACVPGGAYFTGNPRAVLERPGGMPAERLVVLEPFFIDVREVTVGEMRSSGLARHDASGRAFDPNDDVGLTSQECNYTSREGPNEAMPVMCVSWDLAAQICSLRGGRLPSEAQLEVVATQGGSSLYPWGDVPPTCEDAAIGREIAISQGGCRTHADTWTPVLSEVAGGTKRDYLELGGVRVVDLAGNLAEWTRDYFQAREEPCWKNSILFDPVCEQPGRVGSARSVKGGSVRTSLMNYGGVTRAVTVRSSRYSEPDIGFRCVYPGK